MCNGESPRQSRGGAIAILQPTHASATPPTELSLHLTDDASTRRTTATLHGTSGDSTGPGPREVVIHRDGDLRSSTDPRVARSALHRFAIPDRLGATGASFPLDARLDLGVGGEGIVGRRVSVLEGRWVWQGIVGWN